MRSNIRSSSAGASSLSGSHEASTSRPSFPRDGFTTLIPELIARGSLAPGSRSPGGAGSGGTVQLADCVVSLLHLRYDVRVTAVPGKRKAQQLDARALERILEVTRALARPLDVDTMLEQVIDAGRSILGAERGTVFLHDPATDELVSRVATGSGELRVPAARGIVGECARTRQVINVPDCYADSRFNPDVDRKTGYKPSCPNCEHGIHSACYRHFEELKL